MFYVFVEIKIICLQVEPEKELKIKVAVKEKSKENIVSVKNEIELIKPSLIPVKNEIDDIAIVEKENKVKMLDLESNTKDMHEVKDDDNTDDDYIGNNDDYHDFEEGLKFVPYETRPVKVCVKKKFRIRILF